LSSGERETIRALAADLPALWNSPKTKPQDRKEIVRQVIDRVVVQVVGESEKVQACVHWAGGHVTENEIVRPVARLEQLSYWHELRERVRELANGSLKARQIAEQLNREGWRPPKRREVFGPQGVFELLERMGLHRSVKKLTDHTGLGQDEWWLTGLAHELGMPSVTLYTWLRRGWVKSRRLQSGRWALWADAEEVARLRQLRQVPAGQHMHRRWSETRATMEQK
jgi:hypothetical protein